MQQVNVDDKYKITRSEFKMGLQTFVQCLVLLHATTLSASLSSYSMDMDWLRSDGTRSFGSKFDVGDTVICHCQLTIYEGPAVESVAFEMKQYGSSSGADLTPITSGEQIIYSDGRERFSAVNITTVNENITDYRMTLSNIDRYDSGNRYYCAAYWVYASGSRSSGTASTDLKINWSRPEPQCSSDIPDKVKKGDDVTYQCNASDTDERSSGTFTMWRGDTRLNNDLMSEYLDVGRQFNASYSTTISDDSLADVYSCRYIGTGGFQDYDYNCTFNMPTCVVDDLNDQCLQSSGALPSRDHLQVTTMFLVLVFNYYITLR
ncbi:uncharacterized protein LOC117300660 [Asterias rubens]|uniref:uncharacterized protein LOC117300660 n=1 Tax=Asterias rubens TaxID=7604 RepID=UPI0014555554|nr:uncharacterized protein LOC117300660 [Asterias rubens]